MTGGGKGERRTRSASSSSGKGAAEAAASSLSYCFMSSGSIETSGGARAGAATNSRVAFLLFRKDEYESRME